MRMFKRMKIEPATVQALDAAVRLLGLQFDEHEFELTDDELPEAVRALLVDPSRGAVLVAYDPQPVGIAVLAYVLLLPKQPFKPRTTSGTDRRRRSFIG